MKSGTFGMVTFKGGASLIELPDVEMTLGERESSISPVVEMLLASAGGRTLFSQEMLLAERFSLHLLLMVYLGE
jgi:hypothetical protein